MAPAGSVPHRGDLGLPGRPGAPRRRRGVVLDRLLTRTVPAQLVAQLDDSLNLLVEKPLSTSRTTTSPLPPTRPIGWPRRCRPAH